MSDLISTQSSQAKLLVIQPLVGIGDMIWHKPWIDYLCSHNQVILATKPSVQAPVLFAETEGLQTAFIRRLFVIGQRNFLCH